jgi:hypothetical protein
MARRRTARCVGSTPRLGYVAAMTTPTPTVAAPNPLAVIPVSRSRALVRGLVRLAPALLVGLVVRVVIEEVWLREAGLRSRLVDLLQVIVLIPLPALFILLTVSALRWLVLSAWPGPIGFFAFADRLEARLGTFGIRRYDLRRMRVRYFFELNEDEGGVEAYLPEEEQMEQFLPRLHHPDAPRPIHELVLMFASLAEPDLARRLRPAVDTWRHGGGVSRTDSQPAG